jgi:deazaflavin-dependent oxidoreductase (nitroreductase family)
MALPDVAYRLIGRFSVTRFDRLLHPLLYRLAGGRGITGRVLGSDMILLTTTGRRSGAARTVALFAFRRGVAWYVIGSRGGSKTLPAWYRNLVASTSATVQAGGLAIPVLARDLTGDDYEAAFEQAAAAYPGYRVYRRESPIHIPIVLLEPIVPPGPIVHAGPISAGA